MAPSSSGWGATLTGFGDAMQAFDTLERDWAGGTETWVVGTAVEYAVFVELGTSRMKAQPYLRPAVEQAMRDADQLADRATSADELVALLALRIERLAKQFAPVDTGNLMNSIRAEKLG